MTEQLLTEAQLAEWLQVSVKTIQRWRADGTGPPVRWAGARPRYDRGEVETWLKRGGRDQASQG